MNGPLPRIVCLYGPPLGRAGFYGCLGIVAAGLPLASLFLAVPWPGPFTMHALGAIGALAAGYWGRAACAYLHTVCAPVNFRLCKTSWGFQSISGSAITLHFSPEVGKQWAPELLLLRCEQTFGEIASKFESVKRMRIQVFVFSNSDLIASTFGPMYGGFALAEQDSVVVAESEGLLEDLRHEMTHIFSSRWDPWAPPLLVEGLAGHLQGTMWGRPLAWAANRSLKLSDLRLQQLLDGDFFYSNPRVYDCYVLAASFTEFLIRRFGWERYETLYRTCRAACFAADFQKCLGISLDEAEAQWRAQTLSPGVLTRRLGKIVWLCQEG